MSNQIDHEAAILNTLHTYARAYNTHDLDAIMALWAAESDILFSGTGAGEKRVGLAEIRRQFAHNFAKAKTLLFEWTWISVSVSGDSAVVVATARVQTLLDNQTIQVPLRMTITLTYDEGRWLWVHRRAITPAHGQ